MRVHFLVAATALAIGTLLAAPASAEPYAEGYRAFQAGDYARALEAWKPLAEDGEVRAQYGVGVIHERGASGTPDAKKAAQWYRKAAEQGHAGAQNNLALLYAEGKGVDRDRARAVELWQRAAESGHLMAQFNLGLAYYRGRGVAEDQAAALEWFGKAGRGGLANAQYALGQMYRLGIAVPKDEGKALAWYTRAQNQDDTKAAKMAARLRKEGVTPAEIEPVRTTSASDTANGRADGSGDDREAARQNATTAERASDAAEAADSVIESTQEGLAETRTASNGGNSNGGNGNGGAATVDAGGESPANGATTADNDDTDSANGADAADMGGDGDARTQQAAATAAGDGGSNGGAGGGVSDPAVRDDADGAQPEAAGSGGNTTDTETAAADEEGASSGEDEASAKNPKDQVRVWLGSLQTRKAAAQHWSDMQARFPEILRNAGVHYQEINLDEQGTFFRVLAGPYPDEPAAQRVCRDMKAKKDGAFCQVHQPDV